jgi:hypothetical protein
MELPKQNDKTSLVPEIPAEEVVDAKCRDVAKLLNTQIRTLRQNIQQLQHDILQLKTTKIVEPTQSEEQDQLMEAIAKTKSKLGGRLQKTGSGAHNKAYATIDDVLDGIEPVAEEFGIAIKQYIGFKTRSDGTEFDVLTTTLHHIPSKQWFTSTVRLQPDYTKGNLNPGQSLQSATTSMKRYTLGAIFGVTV